VKSGSMHVEWVLKSRVTVGILQHVCVCVSLSVSVCACTRESVSICICVCMCLCAQVCVCRDILDRKDSQPLPDSCSVTYSDTWGLSLQCDMNV